MKINQNLKLLAMLACVCTFIAACQSAGKTNGASAGLKQCKHEGELAFEYAVAKPFILATFAKNPIQGKAGEPWRFLALFAADDKKYSKIPQETKMAIAKSVANTSLSNDVETDAFLFQEYYKLSCNNAAQGVATLALQDISQSEIFSCWDNRNGAVTLNACMAQLATQIQQ